MIHAQRSDLISRNRVCPKLEQSVKDHYVAFLSCIHDCCHSKLSHQSTTKARSVTVGKLCYKLRKILQDIHSALTPSAAIGSAPSSSSLLKISMLLLPPLDAHMRTVFLKPSYNEDENQSPVHHSRKLHYKITRKSEDEHALRTYMIICLGVRPHLQ